MLCKTKGKKRGFDQNVKSLLKIQCLRIVNVLWKKKNLQVILVTVKLDFKPVDVYVNVR